MTKEFAFYNKKLDAVMVLVVTKYKRIDDKIFSWPFAFDTGFGDCLMLKETFDKDMIFLGEL